MTAKLSTSQEACGARQNHPGLLVCKHAVRRSIKTGHELVSTGGGGKKNSLRHLSWRKSRRYRARASTNWSVPKLRGSPDVRYSMWRAQRTFEPANEASRGEFSSR